MNRRNPAQRRYLGRFFPAIACYVVVLFAATWLIRTQHPAGWLLVALAAAPALPILAVIGVMCLYLLEEQDEFLRQRLATSMLVGLGLLLAVLTVWGFLANGGVAAQPPAFLAFPFWCAGFGLAQCAMSMRDRLGERR